MNVVSMREIVSITEPTTIYMGFPAYGEQVRFFNEDFLRLKMRQLQELTRLNRNVRVMLVASDDEYPNTHPKQRDRGITMHNGEMFRLFFQAYNNGGHEAFNRQWQAPNEQDLIQSLEAWGTQVDAQMDVLVVGVHTAIQRERQQPGSVPVLSEFTAPNVTRSRRAGSNWYVLWIGNQLAKLQNGKAYLGYTDADISTNLMQTGMLVGAIRRGADTAIATTEDEKSVLSAKSFKRQMKSLLYNLFVNWTLFQPLPFINRIRDTQRGYKMFSTDIFEDMVVNFKQIPAEFAVDTQMLSEVKLERGTIQEVPIAWMASEKDSTVRESDSRDMLYRVLMQRADYMAPRQGVLRQVMGMLASLATGAFMYVLCAKLDMDAEQHGAAIAKFNAAWTATVYPPHGSTRGPCHP